MEVIVVCKTISSSVSVANISAELKACSRSGKAVPSVVATFAQIGIEPVLFDR